MGKIIFTSNSQKLFEMALNADTESVEAAVEAGAKLLKTYTYNKGRSMGVWRTGQTGEGHVLNSLTVKTPKRGADGWDCYVTYTGIKRKNTRNAEVAFINEYGKRKQPARAFNRLAVENGEAAIIQRMEDILTKDI